MDDVYHTRQGFMVPSEHIPSDSDMLRYANGDETITNQLIEGLMGHVVTSVEWFLVETPKARPYYEDCLSEALSELTSYVNKNLGRRYTPGHFVSTIRLVSLGAVKDWLTQSSVCIRIPRRSQLRHNQVVVQTKLTEEMPYNSEQDVFDAVWFDMFMEGLDAFDQSIVRLKMANLSNREIGRELDIGHQHVKLHLQRLALIFTGN